MIADTTFVSDFHHELERGQLDRRFLPLLPQTDSQPRRRF